MKNEIPFEEFLQAYKDCRKRKRNTYNALAFEVNYLPKLYNLYEDVNNKTYEISKSICFVVCKPVHREIFAGDFRDRIIHHLIINKINNLIEKELIDDIYNCRIGKGGYYGILRLKNKIKNISENYTKDAYIAKFDMKGFFMSINKTILYNKLKILIDNKYTNEDKDILLYLVEKVIFNNPTKNCIIKGDKTLWNKIPKNKSLFYADKNHGLPIGNLSSQIFANYYLVEFDKLMTKHFNGYYGRYVDDFYVISNDKKHILKYINTIKQELNKLDVKLHPNKFYIQHISKGINFIGYTIKNDRLYISKRTVHNTYYKYKLYNKGRCTFDNFIASMNSYLGFMIHTESYGIRVNIVKQICKQKRRYVYSTGRAKKLVKRNKYASS